MTQDKSNSFCLHKILNFPRHQEQFLLQRHPGYLSHRHASPKHRHVCSSSSGWKLSKALKSQNLKLSQLEKNWVNCMVFTRRSLSSGALMSWQLSHVVLSNTILRLSRSPFSFLISPQNCSSTTNQAGSERAERGGGEQGRGGGKAGGRKLWQLKDGKSSHLCLEPYGIPGNLQSCTGSLHPFPIFLNICQFDFEFLKYVPLKFSFHIDFCLGLSGDGASVHLHLHPRNNPW